MARGFFLVRGLYINETRAQSDILPLAYLTETSGSTAASGVLAATEAADIAQLAGNVGTSGALVVTEAIDTAALAGSSTAPAVSGALAVTETADITALTGTIQLVPAGILAASDSADAAQITMGFVAPRTSPVPYPAIVDYGWKRRQPPVPKIKGRRG